jgi:integrase
MVDPPKFGERKKKVILFSLDEIDILLNTSEKKLKNFLGISFFTGMRSTELLALKWDDVDFATDTVSITKLFLRVT